MKSYRYLVALALLVIAGNLFAGQDPVTVSVISGSIPSQTEVGTPYSITYEVVNMLPFAQSVTLTGNASASAVGTAISSSVPACNVGTSISLSGNGGACGVKLVFNPSSAGSYSLYLTMKYGSQTVNFPSPSIQTTTSGNTPPTSSVTGVVTNLSSPITVGSSNTVVFTFTNTGNGSVTINNSTVAVSGSAGSTGFTQATTTNPLPPPYNTTSLCNSITLSPNSSCLVGGIYTPTSPGNATLTAKLTYNGSSTVQVPGSTIVNPTPGQGVVTTLLDTLPATNSIQNVQYIVTFMFKNSNASTESGSIAFSQINGTFTPVTDETSTTCTTASSFNLSPGASCQISGNFVPAAPGAASITATPNPGTPATSSTIAGAAASGRVITFVNQCPFNVYPGFSGAVASTGGCTSDSGCPSGALCNSLANAGAGQCFFPNPTPSDGNYELTARGGSHNQDTFAITSPQFNNTVWNGTIAGRTGCTTPSSTSGSTLQCITADCSSLTANNSTDNDNQNAGCAVGTGFTPPATQSEPTFLPNGVDTYDVEMINGFNIPMEFLPNNATPPAYNSSTYNPYICQAAGNPNPSCPTGNTNPWCPPTGSSSPNGLGSCSWDLSGNLSSLLPSNLNTADFYWVTSGGASCSNTNNTCSAGEVCGFSKNNTGGVSQTCGNFLGYWTANQQCSLVGASTDFQCTSTPTSLTNTYSGAVTFGDFYSCDSPLAGTCYQNFSSAPTASNTTCCGQVDWETEGINAPAQVNFPPISNYPYNTDWINNALPTIKWLKASCPTAYSYPFDDVTTTFTCSNGAGSDPNNTNYTIIFCPGGATGSPANVNYGAN